MTMKGSYPMTHSVMEQIGDQIDDSARKAYKSAAAIGNAIEDGVVATQRVAKHGGDVVAEYYEDTKKRIQRNPFPSVVAAAVVGMVAGAIICRALRYKRS